MDSEFAIGDPHMDMHAVDVLVSREARSQRRELTVSLARSDRRALTRDPGRGAERDRVQAHAVCRFTERTTEGPQRVQCCADIGEDRRRVLDLAGQPFRRGAATACGDRCQLRGLLTRGSRRQAGLPVEEEELLLDAEPAHRTAMGVIATHVHDPAR